jgi:hypothetical protein
VLAQVREPVLAPEPVLAQVREPVLAQVREPVLARELVLVSESNIR